ncbi:glycine receptor subunit alpha-2-like [Tubulanus polymorphus]|uniref:glycine receptor subunit alpha-2-like n=1 Tax=Tubulanus polymorphus TaxID=672921 RepID=UPI003DA3C32E
MDHSLTCKYLILAIAMTSCLSSENISGDGENLYKQTHYLDEQLVQRFYYQQLYNRGRKLSLTSYRPVIERGKPTVVTCDVFINSFDSINVENMDYALQVYIRQSWVDPRLQFATMNLNITKFTLDYRMLKQIWVPDLFFQNEKAAQFHQITRPNTLVRVYPDGTVLYSARISLRLSCHMNLRRFPLDKQICKIKLESYAYTTDELMFRWRETEAVQMQDGLELPQFKLTGHDIVECSTQYITGNFTCLEVKFYLKRQYGYYVLQTYVPSLLIVCVSWVSFWINIDAVPARISLGVLTVLTMTTQSIGLWMTLPRVSYIKAIDAWMACSVIYVFIAMLEFPIVNTMARNEIRRLSMKLRSCAKNQELPHDAFKKMLDEYTYGPSRSFDPDRRHMARRVDKWARIVFPIGYVAFNLIYWTVLVYMLQ